MEDPRLHGPLKRPSFESESESPPSKRRQQPPHFKQSISVIPLKSSAPLRPTKQSSQSRPENPCNVDRWLTRTPLLRPDSCPPRLQGSHRDGGWVISGEENQSQRPLLEVLQEMSQSRRICEGNLSASDISRSLTSHTGYRKILRSNGVFLDPTGEKIPQELRTFIDSKILKERSTQLSPDGIAKAVKTAVDISESPVGNVYFLADTLTGVLPIKRGDVGFGRDTVWYTEGLPRNEAYEYSLAAPKPNLHCDYPMDHRSTFKVEEDAVIDHESARRLTQPTTSNCFPFLVCELNSEAVGGTLWQAENKAAGSGASCVNAARWIYREAHMPEDQSVVDTISFSACVNHRLVILSVHWYSVDEARHYMSWIATFETIRHIERYNHVINNVIDHAMGTRQENIKKALARLYPIPEYWKETRPVSAVDATSDQNASSKKSRRMGET